MVVPQSGSVFRSVSVGPLPHELYVNLMQDVTVVDAIADWFQLAEKSNPW